MTPQEDVPLSSEPAAVVEEEGPPPQEQLLCGEMILEPEEAPAGPSAAAHALENESRGQIRSSNSRPGTYQLTAYRVVHATEAAMRELAAIGKHAALPPLQLQCDLFSACEHIADELQRLQDSRLLCICFTCQRASACLQGAAASLQKVSRAGTLQLTASMKGTSWRPKRSSREAPVPARRCPLRKRARPRPKPQPYPRVSEGSAAAASALRLCCGGPPRRMTAQRQLTMLCQSPTSTNQLRLSQKPSWRTCWTMTRPSQGRLQARSPRLIIHS